MSRPYSTSDEAIYRVAIQQMDRESDYDRQWLHRAAWLHVHQPRPDELEPLVWASDLIASPAPASPAPEAR